MSAAYQPPPEGLAPWSAPLSPLSLSLFLSDFFFFLLLFAVSPDGFSSALTGTETKNEPARIAARMSHVARSIVQSRFPAAKPMSANGSVTTKADGG